MDSKWVNQAIRFAKENAPTILSGVAAAGVVGTAVLAVRATPKAMRKLDEKRDEGNPAILRRDVVFVAWKYYVPAAITGTITIASIFGANKISTARYAGMAAAYALARETIDEYKGKVIEMVGKDKEEKIRAAIAEKKIAEDPPGKSKEVIILPGGWQLCHEELSGRYFRSDQETIRAIQNDFNSEMLSDPYGALPQNAVWRKLGLEETPLGDEVGWNAEYLLEFSFSVVKTPDGEPCLSIGYERLPKANYARLGF